MARWMPAASVMVLLAACSQSEPGRTAIVDRCVAGGETPEICKCLADESSRQLDGDMFDLVVLGAQGEEMETDRRMKELAPERQARFAARMRQIIRGCGADGYVAGS
jgi:hypothetical protein